MLILTGLTAGTAGRPPAVRGNLPGPATADTAPTVVEGFHGHPWGTPLSEIPEIDPSPAVERTAEGLRAYPGELTFLGMPSRALFYVDQREELRMGRYESDPPSDRCAGLFRTFRLMLAGSYPALEESLRRGTGGDAETHREACRQFLEAEDPVPWEAEFRNPRTGHTEIILRMVSRDGEARILACYLTKGRCP